MVSVAEVLAGGISVETFDLVHKPVLKKEIERAVHGRRGDLLALAPGHFLGSHRPREGRRGR